MSVKKAALLAIVWATLLTSLVFIASFIVPYQPSFPYSQTLLIDSNLPKWIYSWANFDGVHYLTIIEKGYIGTGLIQAFFPIYPLLGKVITVATGSAIISLQLISLVSFVGVIWLLSRLAAPQQNTFWVTAAILTFPTSFFFRAAYTESFFLALVLLSFLLMKQKKWWLAALVAAIASGTRITGFFLIPAIMIDYLVTRSPQNPSATDSISSYLQSLRGWITSLWQTIQKKDIVITTILLGLVTAVGFIGYSGYLWITFEDPLYFLHVQSEFGGGRQESLVLLPQVVWRYIKILATNPVQSLRYPIYVLELVSTGLALLALVWKSPKIRFSWLIFSLGALLLPTVTGTFSSMPRYILVAFPLYFILGELLQNNRIFRIIYLPLAVGLQIALSILFIQGYWVA